MNLPERTSDVDRLRTRRRSAVGARALQIVIVGMLFCPFSEAFARAQDAPQSDAQKADQIDPEAMSALDKMGVYLRSLETFQVTADITNDDVTDNGQTVESSKTVNLVAVKPNRLRVEITSDDEHRFFFFDGKNLTIYGQLVNYYATVPVPATIAELSDNLTDKYGIELPLVDLFKWGTDESVMKRIKGAIDVGPTTVGGVTCEQYAFHQNAIDWQIWIQLGQFPLPRKLVIRTLTDDARPQHSETLTWNLAPSFSEDAFTFNPPPDAKRITIAEVRASSTEKKMK